MTLQDPNRQRYHRIDGWRGYPIPTRAVAGASDTGNWDDSPAPTDEVMKELRKLRNLLKNAGIKTRTRIGQSSNVFMAKRWIVVRDPEQWREAAQLVADYIHANNDLRYLHDADLEEVGITPAE